MDTRKKLNEVLEGADIRRQQYDAIADGDTPDDAIKELWELYNESGRAEAKLIGESYATAIKRVREDVHTTEEALTALCIWESALAQCVCPEDVEEDAPNILEWLQAGEGAAQARDNALLLAPLMEHAYQRAVDGGYEMTSFDWEFVPRAVQLFIATSATPADVNRYDAEGAGKTIVGEFLERTEGKRS